MSVLVSDCPRCGSKHITFDLTQQNFLYTYYDWQYWFGAFCICRHCKRAMIFVLSQSDYDWHRREEIHGEVKRLSHILLRITISK
ncbi:MAG: hypothetical protein ACFFCW_28930 [Candidatus Hodarchaeota archaeon]